MGFQGEFVDVTDAASIARATGVTSPGTRLRAVDLGATERQAGMEHATGNATVLQDALNAVHRDGGGYVYFPPGRYYVGRPSTRPDGNDQDADLFVPSNVTLMFAPGAVLVPMRYAEHDPAERLRAGRADESLCVIIEIAGDIDAGLHEIFAAGLYPREDGRSSAEPDDRAGKVIFTGSRVREVYPEWWGALANYNVPRWGTRNRRALQAAIDAAHTDRLRPLRNGTALRRGEAGVEWRAEPSIPIVASFNYAIDRGLVVGRTVDIQAATEGLDRVNPAPFVLRGDREVASFGKTFEASGLFDEPMLDLREVSSFHLQGVGFNGNERAMSCVRVLPGADGGVGNFERCTFQELRNAPNATLVKVETAAPLDGTLFSLESQEPFHVAFTACRFTPIALDRGPVRESPANRVPRVYEPGICALLLDHSDRCTVEVRTSHLQGHADPMIRARRGRFTLNECALHANRRIHREDVEIPSGVPGASQPSQWRRLWNSTNGTDIFLEMPVEGAAQASFTARECESQSFQFLSTWAGDVSGVVTQRSASVLINTHHNAVPGGRITNESVDAAAVGADPAAIPPALLRPSICWEGPGQVGSHFVLMGCCFQSQYAGTWPGGTGDMGCIRVSPNQTGQIFHLANTVKGQPAYPVTTGPARVIAPANFIVPDPGVTSPLLVRAPNFFTADATTPGVLIRQP